MQITQITDETCPVCSAEIVEDRINHRHVNGYWNEYRKFHCGLTLHFIPNYMKVKREGDCENDPVVIKQKKNQRDLLAKLTQTITEADISASVTESLLVRIRLVLE